jgi:hypothetical protein
LITGDRLTGHGVYFVIKQFVTRTNIPRFTPQHLRGSFISYLLDKGHDIRTVADIVGHADMQTTAGYDGRGEERKKRTNRAIQLLRGSPGRRHAILFQRFGVRWREDVQPIFSVRLTEGREAMCARPPPFVRAVRASLFATEAGGRATGGEQQWRSQLSNAARRDLPSAPATRRELSSNAGRQLSTRSTH